MDLQNLKKEIKRKKFQYKAKLPYKKSISKKKYSYSLSRVLRGFKYSEPRLKVWREYRFRWLKPAYRFFQDHTFQFSNIALYKPPRKKFFTRRTPDSAWNFQNKKKVQPSQLSSVVPLPYNQSRWQGRKQFPRKRMGVLLSGQTYWHKCKRPFWRRKSYKRILNQERVLRNPFLFANYSDVNNYQHKFTRKDQTKTLWPTMFKRSSYRRLYKNKILLRYYWRAKYFIWSRNRLRRFILSLRRKRQKILYFLQRYELSLDRYILWWGIIPSFYSSIAYARALIQNGFILVNFIPIFNIRYQVQKGDCILCALQTTRQFPILHLPKRRFFSQFRISPKKTLFIKGYSLSGPNHFKKVRSIRRRTEINRLNGLLFFIWLKKGYSKFSLLFGSRLGGLFERSYYFHIWVNLQSFSWFSLTFSSNANYVYSNSILINCISRLKQF
jgi:hypothetical protein